MIDKIIDAVLFGILVLRTWAENALEFIKHPLKTMDSWLDDYNP